MKEFVNANQLYLPTEQQLIDEVNKVKKFVANNKRAEIE